MEIWLLVGRLTLTGLLYLFLLAVFIVLWRDMRAAMPVNAPSIPERNGRLVIVEGNQNIPAGTILPLQPFTTLGRGTANTIVLPDTYASAEHAIIARRGGQWWLEDRDSRNGTMLNDVRIESPVVLGNGDVIGIGRIKLRLEMGDQVLGIDHASRITHHVSRITHHVSRITYHASRITHHASPLRVTHHV